MAQFYKREDRMGFKRPSRLVVIPYETFRKDVASTGLVGVVVGSAPISALIKRATDSDYSHVLMFGWGAIDCLMVAEAEQPVARVISARASAKMNPGRIDVYRLRDKKVDLISAWSFMLRFAGQDYPEEWLLKNWVDLVFGNGAVIKPTPNSDVPDFPRHCSGSVHAALRTSGMTPIKEYDCRVFPDDFANPKFTEYVCTIG